MNLEDYWNRLYYEVEGVKNVARAYAMYFDKEGNTANSNFFVGAILVCNLVMAFIKDSNLMQDMFPFGEDSTGTDNNQ